MARTVLLSTAELTAEVQAVMEPHIDMAAVLADYRPLLEAVLDQYFHNAALNRSAHQLVVSYGVPTDVATSIVDRIFNRITRMMSAGFAGVIPSRSYSYKLLGETNILITEETPVARFIPDPSFNPDNHHEGLERNDWFSERMRRNLGLT